MNSSLVCAFVDRSENQAGCSSRLEACSILSMMKHIFNNAAYCQISMMQHIFNNAAYFQWCLTTWWKLESSPLSTHRLPLYCDASAPTSAQSLLPWNQAPVINVLISQQYWFWFNFIIQCRWYLLVDWRGPTAFSEQGEEAIKDIFRSWTGDWGFPNHKEALWGQVHQVIVIVDLYVWLIVFYKSFKSPLSHHQWKVEGSASNWETSSQSFASAPPVSCNICLSSGMDQTCEFVLTTIMIKWWLIKKAKVNISKLTSRSHENQPRLNFCSYTSFPWFCQRISLRDQFRYSYNSYNRAECVMLEVGQACFQNRFGIVRIEASYGEVFVILCCFILSMDVPLLLMFSKSVQ